MSDIDVYAIGLCYASVCADKQMTKVMVEDYMNVLEPAGTSLSWTIAEEPFNDGSPNPNQCETDSNKQHWLLDC